MSLQSRNLVFLCCIYCVPKHRFAMGDTLGTRGGAAFPLVSGVVGEGGGHQFLSFFETLKVYEDICLIDNAQGGSCGLHFLHFFCVFLPPPPPPHTQFVCTFPR